MAAKANSKTSKTAKAVKVETPKVEAEAKVKQVRGYQLSDGQKAVIVEMREGGSSFADIKRAVGAALVEAKVCEPGDLENGAEFNEALYRSVRSHVLAQVEVVAA